jgi:hypothetical protein
MVCARLARANGCGLGQACESDKDLRFLDADKALSVLEKEN